MLYRVVRVVVPEVSVYLVNLLECLQTRETSKLLAYYNHIRAKITIVWYLDPTHETVEPTHETVEPV